MGCMWKLACHSENSSRLNLSVLSAPVINIITSLQVIYAVSQSMLQLGIGCG